MTEGAVIERLHRFGDVLRRPNARIYCAGDVFTVLLRACQPGGALRLPAGTSMVVDENLSEGFIVVLAPILPAPGAA